MRTLEEISQLSREFHYSSHSQRNLEPPPVAVFEPWIDKEPNVFDHWGWAGKRNQHLEATLRLQPTPEQLAKGIGASTWVVMRVLFHHLVEPIEKGDALVNTCGIPGCVNPAHAQRITRADLYALHGAQQRFIVVADN